MEISERKKKILAAVVDEYVLTAEPVGSKAIAQKAGLGCSSATIRNELAELVNMGYLEQPHTSAGRIPSELGYRFYVDSLMHRYSLTIDEISNLQKSMDRKYNQLESVVSEISDISAEIRELCESSSFDPNP